MPVSPSPVTPSPAPAPLAAPAVRAEVRYRWFRTARNVRRILGVLDAHVRFALAVGVGAAVFFLLPAAVRWPTRAIMAYDAGLLCFLVTAWVVMSLASSAMIQNYAWRQDASRTAMTAVVLLTACGGLLAICSLPGGLRGPNAPTGAIGKDLRLLVSLAAVVSSWLSVHTVFALHYARRYYQDLSCRPRADHPGGLVFPDRRRPDYWDFAYYAFVVGMTSQVSDVTTSSRRMRRLTLIHGVLSFFFNTAVLALAINVVAGGL